MTESNPAIDMVQITTDIVAAYVSNNSVPAQELGVLIANVHSALTAIATGTATAAVPSEPQQPAVPVKKSITPDYIVCLEDGKRMKSLKRHLTTLGMTPESYRAKWNLPRDYPMVAPNYAKARSDLAKAIGLGTIGGRTASVARTEEAAKAPEASETPAHETAANESAPARRGRGRPPVAKAA